MSIAFDFMLIFYEGDHSRDNFTSQLLHLIAKADVVNMAKIELGFPEAVRLYKAWMSASVTPPQDKFEEFARGVLNHE